ncbi:Sau3AI family type II restriction endonuclease [Peribacillus asahii]|uniref:Sau3AI family type II restriction endonuclease n=1 Tax=Peribacillus asahii TaxID=228899 RepID=UPI003805B39E
MSIKEYGEALIGKTFLDVLDAADIEDNLKQEIITKTNNPNYKGGMGHLIEEYHFEYKINNDQEPDFPKAGVELKVTPYEIGKKGGYSAGERLVITMISYQHAVEEDFHASHAYKKLRLTLLVHYLRDRSLPRIEYPIDFVTLFSPPEEDLKIIQQDYEKIITKVKEGKAHELSEGDTMYLGACTKGSNSVKSNVPQEFYAPELKARKRAFCFKQSYMSYILNQYVRKKVDTYESILSNVHDIDDKTFEEIIIGKINTHRGKTDTQLSNEFEVKRGPNNFWSLLAYRMLGIKSNRAKEFVKANIEVKTIRIEENGTMNESISFPSFTMRKFTQEEWEESGFYNNLSSKRYLIVVFKKQGDNYVLKGCRLWNISNEDLDEARIGWEAIQQIVLQGVKLWKDPYKNGTGFRVKNNFPKKEDNRIIHIRPHTSERYYILGDGEIIGNNPSYGDELPDGRVMTKQCFWLNNSYILNQLDENLKK